MTLLLRSRALKGALLAFTVTSLLACHSAPKSKVLPGGLAADKAFIAAYGLARERATQAVPAAILAMPGELVVVRYGEITERASTTTPLYTALKEISHVLLALWVAAWDTRTTEASRQTAAFAPHVDALSAGLSESVIPERDRQRQRELLAAARKLIAEAAAGEEITRGRLVRWARGVAPAMLENVREAARSQLNRVNKEMARIVETMTLYERQKLIVVVSGAHQAREKNIQMQYFRALLGPEAAVNERRLFFAESIRDTEGMLNALGAHELDRSIAVAFFASPTRMQRDLLGDAAEKIIPTLEFPSMDH